MADMMASGEVGLSYALHMFAHHWDQGLLLSSVFYFILYYFSLHIRLCRTYVNRIDYSFPPPLSPCAIRQRGGGARHHLVMLSHANMRNVMGSVGWARQVRSDSVLVERRRSLTALPVTGYCLFVVPFRVSASTSASPSPSQKTASFASGEASLPSSLVAVPVSVLVLVL
jgi:hypothetical protein